MALPSRAKAALAATLCVAVLAGLCWRLTIGIDLSDEAYYAAFVDDWIKGGIAGSTFLVLHQTAALLVYPAAALYCRLHGSTGGLFLFLRGLFLAGNCIAAGAMFLFVRRFAGNCCALAIALASVSFIPFTLPAPSYNTLGLQGIMVALASAGCAFCMDTAHARLRWALVSALAWGVAVIAYPPLVAAAAFLCLMLLLFLRGQEGVRAYILLAAAAVAIGAGMMVEVFSWAKLHDSFTYLAAFNGSDNFRRKLDAAWSLFAAPENRKMTCMYAPFFLLGLARLRLGGKRTALVLALLLLGILLFFPRFPGELLFQAQDAITLTAVAGLGLLFDLRSQDARSRLVAVLYATGFATGIIYAAVSTVGIINFGTGAFFAALISVAATARQEGARPFASAAGGVLALLLWNTSVSMYFGDDPRLPVTRERVAWGAAQGLRVRSDQFAVINAMRDVVMPLMRPCDTLLVLGGSPGLLLQTPARTKARSIYAMTRPNATQKALELTHAFYRDPANRPDIVIMYHDSPFINPFGGDFTKWYAPVFRRNYPGGLFEVFRKRVTPLA